MAASVPAPAVEVDAGSRGALSRRDFIKLSGGVSAALGTLGALAARDGQLASRRRRVRRADEARGWLLCARRGGGFAPGRGDLDPSRRLPGLGPARVVHGERYPVREIVSHRQLLGAELLVGVGADEGPRS